METVLQRQFKERSTLENKLRKEIIKYFNKLEKQVLATYEKAYQQGIPPYNIQTLILVLIQSWHKEYSPLILKYNLLLRKLASKQNEELIKIQQKKTLGLRKSEETLTLNPNITLDDEPINYFAIKAQTTLDGVLPEKKEEQHYIIRENKIITQQIEQASFKFCEKTRARVTNEINEILTHSETEGIGPYQVAEQIRDKFGKLKGYEANRIARTEINRADNTYRYEDLMQNDLIDYFKWHSNLDSKTRGQHKHDKADHIHMNGEIIRKGDLFSNGLLHPGDPNGPPYEVINCRCTLTPWICPFDKIVPTGKTRFTESDLIDKPADAGQQFLLETLENTRVNMVEGGYELDMGVSEKVMNALSELFSKTNKGKFLTKGQLQNKFDEILNGPKIPSVTISSQFGPGKRNVPLSYEERKEWDDLITRYIEGGGKIKISRDGKPVLSGDGGLGKDLRRFKQLLRRQHMDDISEFVTTVPTVPSTKPKSDAEKLHDIFNKMDDNNVTVHTGKNLEKPVYVQNGEEIIKPKGIKANELEEFEKLYSNLLDNVLSPQEQTALNKLMNRLKKNGGYVRVSQEGKVQVNWRGRFTSKERKLLRDLQQKRVDVLMENNIKPTFSTSVIPPKPASIGKPKPTDVNPETVWTPEDQHELDDLMAKLESNGGTVKIVKGKVKVEAGGFKGITRKEIIRLEELHNKRLKTKLHPVKPKPKSKPKFKPKNTVKKPITTKPRVNTGLTPELTSTKPEIPTNEVNKMSFKELAEYYNVEYKGLVKYDYDGRKYHTFVEEVPGGKTLTIRMEDGAVKSYTKAGIASPQEILQEVMRVPKVHKIDTDEIWFKNTNQGIQHRFSKSGYDSLDATCGGYNTHYSILDRGRKLRSGKIIDDPNHCIVINPKHFKGSKKDAIIWKQKEGHITNWKHTIRHEFSHSTDISRERFRKGLRRASYEEDYRSIEREEPEFTWYANTCLEESYAEHGGFVSNMLEHPEEQGKKITIELRENGKTVKKDINFEDYKKMYPKHYEYFLKLYTGG